MPSSLNVFSVNNIQKKIARWRIFRRLVVVALGDNIQKKIASVLSYDGYVPMTYDARQHSKENSKAVLPAQEIVMVHFTHDNIQKKIARWQ